MGLLQSLLLQPGAGSSALIAGTAAALLGLALLAALTSSGAGAGNRLSFAQLLFGAYVRVGRVRNLLCAPCDRVRRVYPTANTCQIPFFKNLSDVYSFVFGYKPSGLFVEVGAYDGESFSNTSGLADMGWAGHYVEPIPQYADAARRRHAGNAPRVQVHTVCIGERDGETVELSAAGPFSSAVADEIESVAASSLHTALSALGWGHSKAAPRVKATTQTLDSFFKRAGLQPGDVDVLVIDVEGFEMPILRPFPLAHWRPKLVIVEVQELQARYRDNARVQADAAALFAKMADAGYAIFYKDCVNTIFIHRTCQCVGGA